MEFNFDIGTPPGNDAHCPPPLTSSPLLRPATSPPLLGVHRFSGDGGIPKEFHDGRGTPFYRNGLTGGDDFYVGGGYRNDRDGVEGVVPM